MSAPGKAYKGEGANVFFDARCCLHVAECVRGLPGVFDTDKRPWIQPDNADALLPWSYATARPGRFTTRLPVDEAGEVGDDKTQITPLPDGPLMLRGRLEIETSDGTLHETRADLCRCGRSGNKPLCGGTHSKVGWRG